MTTQAPIEGSTRAQRIERAQRRRVMGQTVDPITPIVREADGLGLAQAWGETMRLTGVGMGRVLASAAFRWLSRVLVLAALLIMAQPILWVAVVPTWIAWRIFRAYVKWEVKRVTKVRKRLTVTVALG